MTMNILTKFAWNFEWNSSKLNCILVLFKKSQFLPLVSNSVPSCLSLRRPRNESAMFQIHFADAETINEIIDDCIQYFDEILKESAKVHN